MSEIILVAETGSDITSEMAKEYNIVLVPMHVTMGAETLDDGSFPVDDICEYYNKTGTIPQTSGCSPYDFTKVFEEIHRQWPEKKILHLAYSAVTTCSYQSAVIAAKDCDYIRSIDTKSVSAGQGAIVIRMAEMLKENPKMTLEEAQVAAERLISRACMCFIPSNLAYLRAGGRLSNVAYIGTKLLRILPCIEILDGKLIATTKYRGHLEKLVPKIMHSYIEKHNLERERLWLLRTTGLPENICRLAERTAAEMGVGQVCWITPGSVITTHGGPGAFGIAGFTAEE